MEEKTKTLKQLGYKRNNDHEIFNCVRFARPKGGYNPVLFVLWENGKVQFYEFTTLTQELYKAIELEMKKLGWWK